MENENLISVIQFCDHHNIEHTFIQTLNENDLIELMIIEDHPYIHTDMIEKVEKIIRLHFDLSINIEGIDVILQLLDRIEKLEEELANLKNGCY